MYLTVERGYTSRWNGDTPHGGTEDVPHGGTEDAPHGGTEDVPHGGTEDAPHGGTEDVPHGGTGSTPHGGTEDVPHGGTGMYLTVERGCFIREPATFGKPVQGLGDSSSIFGVSCLEKGTGFPELQIVRTGFNGSGPLVASPQRHV